MADSTATRLTTGIAPGRPRQVGQTWVLGSAPNSVGNPQNIFELVLSLTWTSRPIAGSNFSSDSVNESSVSELAWVVIGSPPGREPCRAAVRPTPARAGS